MVLSDNSKLIPARLILQTGQTFEGFAPHWCPATTFGEVVFTTGMTGYVESLTDPSFAGQILNFTFPLIGNYGVPSERHWESARIHASGVIVGEISSFCDHHEAVQTLAKWLEKQGVPYLTGVDTRALTRTLRACRSSLGAITHAARKPRSFPDPNCTHLVKQISTKKIEVFGQGKKTVIAVDCGMKENIIRCLQNFPVTIKRVPFDYDYSNDNFDGIFLSNGPGDPSLCTETIAILKKALLRKKPVFGICLGAQLLALASGAKTYKLRFGHRGHNQPCQNTETKRCYLTSQNHGYAIDEKTLSKDWRVSFYNLNDDSVAGIKHRTLPFFAVQFHPEASPGPIDTYYLFDDFYQLL